MNRFCAWGGHAWLALAARLYLGWIFIAASWHKLAYPGLFAVDIATYEILPLALINLLAIILPALELACGVLFVVGFRVKASALLISGLMVMFTVAVSIALAQGLDTSCGCFASQALENDPISWLTIVRDVIWTLMAAYVLFLDNTPLGIDRFWLRGVSREEAR